jgi:hypothetical protein
MKDERFGYAKPLHNPWVHPSSFILHPSFSALPMRVFGISLLLALFAGCSRNNDAAATLKAPPESEKRGATASRSTKETARSEKEPEPAAAPEGRKKMFGLIPVREAVPGYGWDGQHSIGTVKTNMDSVLACGVQALRNLGFVLKNEECKRESVTVARMMGAKKDETVAWVFVEEKTPGVITLKARIGTVGERTGSERVLDEIQKVLLNPPVKKKS